MPTPKFRTSASKRDMRRSHHALKLKSGSVCPNCASVKHAHCVCPSCGHYRGRQVTAVRNAETDFVDSFGTES